MRYCKKCVQPDTRPDIVFDKEGICLACRFTEHKPFINWHKLERQLGKIVKKVKMKNNIYDAVLGVSGGKDSTYTSLYARDILGLHCLLVNSEPEGITDIGKKNIENLKSLGFDVFSIRPNPFVMRWLILRDFLKYLNPVKVTEYSLWSSAYIIAEKFNIPLIIQGENPAISLGVTKGLNADDNALNADLQNTLRNGWTQYVNEGITEKDLFLFHYDKANLINKGIKAIWLSFYDKDWSPRHNAEFSIKHGLTIRKDFNPEDIGTYVPWAQLDSDLVQVNQMLKYYKFGFGQCTDYCCYDIRDGLLKREDAWDLLDKYDGKCATRYIQKFCWYVGISEAEFWEVTNQFVNRELFEKVEGKWLRTFQYDR